MRGELTPSIKTVILAKCVAFAIVGNVCVHLKDATQPSGFRASWGVMDCNQMSNSSNPAWAAQRWRTCYGYSRCTLSDLTCHRTGRWMWLLGCSLTLLAMTSHATA